MICASPASLEGRTLVKLSKDELCGRICKLRLDGAIVSHQKLGSLISRHDGDGERERHNTKALINKTMTLHVRYRSVRLVKFLKCFPSSTYLCLQE